MEASESSTASAAPWATPDPLPAAPEPESDTFAERPEVFVGAAFAGGLGVALVLRWLGSR
jgi:hypothetical protein